MNDALITWALLLVGLVFLWIGSYFVRRRRTPLALRPIEAYRVMPLIADETIESNRLPHISLGASGIGGETTVTALASADVMYYLVRRMSFSKQIPLVTLSDPITLLLSYDTLRRAYAARDNLESFRATASVWVPQGERSMVFAAGAASLSQSVKTENHVLLGTFGSELAYFGEVHSRRNQLLIANSTLLEGQAVAFAMSDHPLIGEELFVGGAYLHPENSLRMGSLIAQDVLRWLTILSILAAALYYGSQ